MKKIIPVTMMLSITLFSMGCKQQNRTDSIKILVVYFSHSGNTRVVAEKIKAATGGDIFEIVPVNPYPTEYNVVVDQARKEIDAGFRPELKSKPGSIDEYDIIIVGSPNWWSTIAPPVATFLTNYDFKGKIIAPFMTHEGTAMGHSVEDIKKLCPGAEVLEGLPIRGGSVNNSQKQVEDWLGRLNIKKST